MDSNEDSSDKAIKSDSENTEDEQLSSLDWHEASAASEDEFEELAEVVITNNIDKGIEPLEHNSSIIGNSPVDLSSHKEESGESAPKTHFDNDEEKSNFFDKSKLVSVDEYREGKIRVSPLEGRHVGNRTGFDEVKPSFLSGRFPKFKERGVPYPQPGKLFFTSLIVMSARVMLVITLIVLALSFFIGTQGIIMNKTDYGLWVVIPVISVFLLSCLMHFISTHQTRCRVCSCQFFRFRRCDKHRLAHRIPIFGYAFGSALHLVLFKWMRCMYCGTAIRLRQKKEQEELTEE